MRSASSDSSKASSKRGVSGFGLSRVLHDLFATLRSLLHSDGCTLVALTSGGLGVGSRRRTDADDDLVRINGLLSLVSLRSRLNIRFLGGSNLDRHVSRGNRGGRLLGGRHGGSLGLAILRGPFSDRLARLLPLDSILWFRLSSDSRLLGRYGSLLRSSRLCLLFGLSRFLNAL